MGNSHMIAWAAGLFDGEGCVRIMKKCRRKSLLRVQVGMSHLPNLKKLAELFPNCSKIREVKQKKPNRKQIYMVDWAGKKGEEFLRSVRPYLITKADDAKIAFAFMAAPAGPAGDPAREEECERALKKRGNQETKTHAGAPAT